LSADHFTFGSFNSLAKVNPRVLQAWAAILVKVPGSHLILKDRALGDPAVAQRIQQQFEQHGIPSERLELVAFLPEASDHFALYGRVDMALDPFPYPGITTTCEALWMGVPVLTLRWPTHAGRMGAGLLEHLSMPEWIADNEADYVDRAAVLATDRNLLAVLRETLRTRMEASPLRDETGLARSLERAYREMWKGWCERS
jgi:predicted O-linked N-acetylglucosamine transferase (SPINDLY family)